MKQTEDWEKGFDSLPYDYRGITPDGVIKRFIRNLINDRDTLWRKRIEEIIGQDDPYASEEEIDFIYKANKGNFPKGKLRAENENMIDPRNKLRAEQRRCLDTLLQESS
jgi:hypothetical protein